MSKGCVGFGATSVQIVQADMGLEKDVLSVYEVQIKINLIKKMKIILFTFIFY